MEDQKTKLMHFLRSLQPDDIILPIHRNEANHRQVDVEIAIPEDGVYRVRWEREIGRYDYNDYLERRRDVVDPVDYPELADPRSTCND